MFTRLCGCEYRLNNMEDMLIASWFLLLIGGSGRIGNCAGKVGLQKTSLIVIIIKTQ